MAALNPFLRAACAVLAVGVAAGCSTVAPATDSVAERPRYRCEHDVAFTVRFTDDTALLDAGPRGYDLLYRDAGGITAQQAVYANPRVRAEFGLGAGGNEAVLRYLLLPLVVRCVRD